MLCDWLCVFAVHLQKREVNNFLGDVIKHMTVDRAFENHYPQVSSTYVRMLCHQCCSYTVLCVFQC